MKRSSLIPLVVFAVGCSSSPSAPKAPPPMAASTLTPTPGVMTRLNPNVIEETATYYIQRLPKADYVKVDERHIRSPFVTAPVEFFKEDDQYYYIRVAKPAPVSEEEQQLRAAPRKPTPAGQQPSVSLSEFEDLQPSRIESSFELQNVHPSGLPELGMWRASFAVADVNGDGIPDIVAPPLRMGGGKLYIWIGDGTGRFSEWPLSVVEQEKPVGSLPIEYGGVAVGDIDGDGHADVVSASHGAGVLSFFGDGKGGFEMVRTGLPKDFSSQAILLVRQPNGTSPNIVVSSDQPKANDLLQVRSYAFLSRKEGWELQKGAILGGSFSICLNSFDYNGDGWADILTGSQWANDNGLLWTSQKDGTYKLTPFPEIELQSLHLSTVPGTFGPERKAAIADAYFIEAPGTEGARANGISLYVYQGGTWSKQRLWRKKAAKTSLYGLAMGDLNGDGLDDVVFLDNDARRVRVLIQQPGGSFAEIPESDEPYLDSFGQCVRIADLNRDGRLDLVVSKTRTSANPTEKGGWSVYLNLAKDLKKH